MLKVLVIWLGNRMDDMIAFVPVLVPMIDSEKREWKYEDKRIDMVATTTTNRNVNGINLVAHMNNLRNANGIRDSQTNDRNSEATQSEQP